MVKAFVGVWEVLRWTGGSELVLGFEGGRLGE